MSRRASLGAYQHHVERAAPAFHSDFRSCSMDTRGAATISIEQERGLRFTEQAIAFFASVRYETEPGPVDRRWSL
jgi:hypothetical protein